MRRFDIKRNKSKYMKWSTNLFVSAFVIPMSFVLIYPLLYMVSMAFRPVTDMRDPTIVWLSSAFTMDNIKTMWTQMEFGTVFTNSVIISLGCALLSTAVSALTGYGFARFKFREKFIWIGVLFITIILPPSVMSVASYIEFKDFSVFGILTLIKNLTGAQFEINMLDSYAVYFLPALFGAGINSGIFILVFMQFFKNFPKELEDSAYIDGAGPIRTFVSIVLPNMKPPTVVVAMLSTVWYWNDTHISSTFAVKMNTISKRLLYVYTDMVEIIGSSSGHGAFNEQTVYIQAGMLMAIIPMLLLFIFCQKVFVESVTTSGITG